MDNVHLSGVHDAMRDVLTISHQLNRLAIAFHVVGNKKISDELDDMSRDLHAAHDSIGRNLSLMISHDLNESMHSVGRMLVTLLENDR